MEVKTRELEARTLLALECACRGYRVYLGNQSHIRWALRKGELPPGLFFDKSLTTGKERSTQRLIDYGCTIASIDEESGLLDESYDHFLDVRSNRFMVQSASGIFCWGSHDYSAWTERYPEAKRRIHLTGSPRVDFWRSDFEPYYHDEVRMLRERLGEFVLVVTNMGYANGIVDLPEQIRIMRKDGTIKSSEDETRKRREFADDQLMLEHFIQLVDHLGREYPNTQFVLRPHPAERLDTWKQAMEGVDNVRVIREGSVSKWVRAAKAVIHEGDTTGLEARVSGTLPIAFVPFDSPRNREIPNRVSLACRTEADVSRAVADALSNETHGRLSDHDVEGLLQNRFANITGALAAERIASVLSKMPAPQVAPQRISSRFRRKVLRSTVRRFVSQRTGRLTRNMTKFSGLSHQELRSLRSGLCRIRPEYSRVSIRKVFGHVFVLEQRDVQASDP